MKRFRCFLTGHKFDNDCAKQGILHCNRCQESDYYGTLPDTIPWKLHRVWINLKWCRLSCWCRKQWMRWKCRNEDPDVPF